MLTDPGEPSSKHAQSKPHVLQTEPGGSVWVSLALHSITVMVSYSVVRVTLYLLLLGDDAKH